MNRFTLYRLSFTLYPLPPTTEPPTPNTRLTPMIYPHIPNLRLGTSSWSSDDWVGTFYPPDTKSSDFLGIYAQHLDTVEVDSTYYRIPSDSMVRNWRAAGIHLCRQISPGDHPRKSHARLS